MQDIFEKIIADPRYQANLDWGVSRSGHPEGTVRAHIAELESNLEAVRSKIPDDCYWKLKVLVHTHDTFKAEAKPDVPITDPGSHASLARQFLSGYCNDQDLLNMVQFHDEGHALWRQFQAKSIYQQERFANLLSLIRDWDLFLWFTVIDGCTQGKSRDGLRWFVNEVNLQLNTSVTVDSIF